MSEILDAISTALIKGDFRAMPGLTNTALNEGLAPRTILDQGLVPGMDYVGAKFKKGQMFVPEVLLSAKAMQGSLDILRPLLAQSGEKMLGTIVIGTIKGDLHDIGKNLVAMMLEGAGFTVHDLGKDVSPAKFVEAVKTHDADIVGMSALLTTTMRGMGATIQALQDAGVRDRVKVMVGGAPVTQEFAQQIGADGFASSAPVAAEVAKSLLASGQAVKA